MHSYECVGRDDDAKFYSKNITLVTLAETKNHICGLHAVLDENVQFLEREEIDPYRLKLPLHYRHIVDVSELVMPKGSGWNLMYTTYGAIAYKLG